jgi:hypothetical protein
MHTGVGAQKLNGERTDSERLDIGFGMPCGSRILEGVRRAEPAVEPRNAVSQSAPVPGRCAAGSVYWRLANSR